MNEIIKNGNLIRQIRAGKIYLKLQTMRWNAYIEMDR